jgi:hypothetical protein
MPDSKISESSLLSKSCLSVFIRVDLWRKSELAGVIALLTFIGVTAASWCFSRGYVLYYGDAEAHLNIARRILDSRTPGPEQMGTAWLPLPHLLMIPFVMHDPWWRNGLAGTIPSVACFVLAGTFLFAAARRCYGSASAALAVTLLFALNPNMLYLQATPMTEPLMMASVAVLLWATLWFRDSQSMLAILIAAAASDAASLTRYEGWFLIPFVTIYFLWVARRKWMAVFFAALAAIAPLAWLAHNRFYYSNALEFYNGRWSALAINGNTVYPGYHDWRTAIEYYSAAARWVCGWPVIVVGMAGALVAFRRRALWPLVFFLLTPLFYIWSIHSSGNPIYIPDQPPYSWYNTRYALGVLLLASFAGGALVMLFPLRQRLIAAVILAAIPATIWTFSDRGAITWKESEVNSKARRAWTQEAAGFLAAQCRGGDGVAFSSFGELAAVLREVGIPLRDTLQDGNAPEWFGAVSRPDIFLHEQWALAFSGDELSMALQGPFGGAPPSYLLQKKIQIKDHPTLEIYHRR